jgi:hypothetical protein
MKSHRRLAATVASVLLVCGLASAAAAHARTVTISELKLSDAALNQLRDRFVDQVYAHHSLGTWAPMRFDLSDSDLQLMGLPSKRTLLAHRYKTPTAVPANGRITPLGAKAAGGPAVASFAGTGFFGIRPGAWLLLLNGGSIGWCSAAHVYGSPGAYKISTAGHCGKVGDVATVVGVVGNHTPVLIDIGKFTSSTGDAGIGKDWALISVDAAWQKLVTPTMAFWGGPIGMYRATGEVVSADLTTGKVKTNPSATLVQQVVHYGHGAGVGAGGTPRSGTAINWRSSYFTFFGAITPGDSGSGTNTLTGDKLGANRQAAGINTHIYVDSSLRTGLGTMAGTRATLVGGTLANGQLVPYPVPLPAGP